MKHLVTLLSALCLSFLTYGQANEKGTINLDFLGGLGLYNASTYAEYLGNSETEKDLFGVSAYLNLNAEYSITD